MVRSWRWNHAGRHWVAVLAVLLIVGCGGPSPSPQATKGVSAETKRVFLVRLIGFCAGVNQRLAKAGPNPDPGKVAGELEGLIHQAVSEGVPNKDRGEFDALLTALSEAAGRWRAAEEARAAKDAAAEAKAQAEAQKAQAAADTAAVNYGMPHLKNCDKPHPYAQMAEAAPGGWQQGTKAPLAVQQAATAVLDGNIWVIGGLVGGQASSKIEIYDPVLSNWSPGPDLPTPLHHAMAVFYQGELMVAGGFAEVGDNPMGTALNGVYRLVDGKTWMAMPPLVHARGAGAAAVIGNKIVVAGGRQAGNQLVPETEVFDGRQWQAAAPIPVPLDHVGAVSDGAALYVVGGRKLSAGQSSGALQRFDAQTGRWSQLPPMPTSRGGLGAALIDGRILAVGGEASASTDRTVEAYDLDAAKWATLPELPAGRHGLAVAAVNHHLYAIAGAANPGHLNASNDVEQLDLSGSPGPGATAGATPSTSPPPLAGPTIYTCPGARSAEWICLKSAAVRNGALTLRYSTNFAASPAADHLHFYTANPDGRGGTKPPAAIMTHTANQGSWFNIYDSSVKRIDAGTQRGGKMAPLDTGHFSLLCARVVNGMHMLRRDKSGGLGTGNCVQITR